MSKVVTPPDIVNEDTVYLVVNADTRDLEMVTGYLQISKKDYTIHLYYDGMSDLDWLNNTANLSQLILVNRPQTGFDSINQLLDHVDKIRWFGEKQPYHTVMDFMLKNGRDD